MQKQPHEHFLRGIVGIVFVAQQAITNAPHPLAKTLHQRHEGGTVRPLSGRSRRQLFVGKLLDNAHMQSYDEPHGKGPPQVHPFTVVKALVAGLIALRHTTLRNMG